MRAAVESGDAKKLAELIREDPGFNVNMDQNGFGRAPYCTSLAGMTVDPPLFHYSWHILTSMSMRGAWMDTLPFIGLALDAPRVFVRC